MQGLDPGPSGYSSPTRKRGSVRVQARINSLDRDILCIIFSLLDIFDLVRCTAVCKSWNAVINGSKLLQLLHHKMLQNSLGLFDESNSSRRPLNVSLEELAVMHHRFSLQKGRIDIDQWRGHSAGIDQCRMKRGLLLTGVGDKVMRLWSLDKYKCIEEYPLSDNAPLVDFDFDESKIVGLVGTRISIWRRGGKRSIFPSSEGTFPKGLCLRYFDPEAVVGCEDGSARVFDMYSRKCSRIIRMHAASVTCLCLSDDQLILSGSSLGGITISGLSSNQQVATLKSTDRAGIKALCFNPYSNLVFAGTTAGYTHCWDLRTMKLLWQTRVSPNVIYSLQHMQNDTSTLVVGGIDGVLRVLDQNSGDILSSCVIDDGTPPRSFGGASGAVERRKGKRLSGNNQIDNISRNTRPPITCLAVGMKKVVTTHNSKYIRVWKFNR